MPTQHSRKSMNLSKLLRSGWFATVIFLCPSLAHAQPNVDFDWDGDGKADQIVSSRWGLGLLGMQDGSLESLLMIKNGTQRGTWTFNASRDQVVGWGDFDGDGRDEVILKSSSALRILGRGLNRWSTVAQLDYGATVDGFKYRGEENEVRGVADFNGDNVPDILLADKKSMLILSYFDNAWQSNGRMVNDEWYGQWRFHAERDRIRLLGQFDGLPGDDILISSPWGVGVLAMREGDVTTIAIHENDSYLDEWKVHSAKNDFYGPGDFDGNGIDEIVAADASGFTALSVDDSGLRSIAMANNGTLLGEWRIDTVRNRFSGVGDLTGDGRDEIVVESSWGFGVLELNGNQFQSPVAQRTGSNIGEWAFDIRRNNICQINDIDGDGTDEILLTSNWGLGVFELKAGRLSLEFAHKNGVALGDWRLGTRNDRVHGCGLQPDTECGYGDEACSVCVKSVAATINDEEWEFSNRNNRTEMRYGRSGTSHGHVQSLARLSDVVRDGQRIARQLFTDHGHYTDDGLVYGETVVPQGQDSVFSEDNYFENLTNVRITDRWPHPGGASSHGNVVSIGMGHGKTSPGVMFVRFDPQSGSASIIDIVGMDEDLGIPEFSPEIESVSAASFLQLKGGAKLMAFINAGRVWLFRSKEQALSGSTLWTYIDHWRAFETAGEGKLDRRLGGAQSIDLVAGCNGKVYLFALNGNAGATGKKFSWVQLLELEVETFGRLQLHIAGHKRRSIGRLATREFSFRWGAATYITEDGGFVLLDSERDAVLRSNKSMDGNIYYPRSMPGYLGSEVRPAVPMDFGFKEQDE